MKTKNQISFLLIFLSFFLLYPGVMNPMLTITMKGAIQSSFANINLDILNKSSSIIQTIQDLKKTNDQLPANLILIFSIIIPIIKGLLLLSTKFIKNNIVGYKIVSFVTKISKWSMADVFVVAIFLAYLSTKSQSINSVHQLKIMGMNIKFNIDMVLHSKLESGFYFFLSYCLVSLIALQLLKNK